LPIIWEFTMSIAASNTSFPVPAQVFFSDMSRVRLVRRRIGVEAGHALEILGHAIEYLVDESNSTETVLPANDPRADAVRLLMELNRQIYFDCPEVHSIADSWRSFLRSHGA